MATKKFLPLKESIKFLLFGLAVGYGMAPILLLIHGVSWEFWVYLIQITVAMPSVIIALNIMVFASRWWKLRTIEAR